MNASHSQTPQLADARSLMAMLEAAPIAIVTVDQNGIILYSNTKLEDMFGYTREELRGQPVEMLMPERFRGLHVEHRTGYLRMPHVRAMGSGMDLIGLRKNGGEFPMEAGLSYLHVDGELIIMSSITDITRRKQTEEMLELRVRQRTRELERRREVADGLRDILAILNSNRSLEEILDHIVVQATRLLYADASAVYSISSLTDTPILEASHGIGDMQLALANRLLADDGPLPMVLDYETSIVGTYGTDGADGLPPEEAGTSVDDETDDGTEPPLTHISTVERPRWNPQGQALLETGYRALLSVPLMVKEEMYGNLMLYYTEPRKFSPEEIDLAITVGDHAALAIENARLRTQVERTAVAAERSRIARDLHDSVTQTLFSAAVIAEVLPRLWQRDQEESERRLNELRLLTRGALAEMRTLLLELRPATLIEVDLGELFRQLTEAITGRARVPVTLHVEGDCTIAPDAKVAFYHIAQEALNNVAKHARATKATVALQCSQELVEMHIQDDGRGFVLEKVTPEHLGLTIMRERAEGIGATIEIKSRPGGGTNVRVHWTPGKMPEKGRNSLTKVSPNV